MMQCLEQVTFRLNPGSGPADLRAALDQLKPWLQAQPGFQYSTVTAEADTLTHLVFWSTQGDAQAASAAIGAAPEAQALMACINPDSVRMDHFQILQAYGPQVLEAA
ncbi:MAG: hypothetical protein AAF245_02995 [Pseudomonadota bacterium]